MKILHWDVFLCLCFYVFIGYIKTRPNVQFSLYLNKAGLASQNVVHLQKIILCCVGLCFCILYLLGAKYSLCHAKIGLL